MGFPLGIDGDVLANALYGGVDNMIHSKFTYGNHI